MIIKLLNNFIITGQREDRVPYLSMHHQHGMEHMNVRGGAVTHQKWMTLSDMSTLIVTRVRRML